jgi:hypothetical protein
MKKKEIIKFNEIFKLKNMPKRFTDTEIWKNQRWFRKLSPTNKLIFFYIKDQCNHAGIWKIDCSDLIDDLGLEKFNLEEFINEMNLDYDKINGEKTHKERVKIIKNNNLWITGFIQFQYESKEKLVSESACVKTALSILRGLDIYDEALNKGYVTLRQKEVTLTEKEVTLNQNDITLSEGAIRLKDKDKDKDTYTTINNTIKNNNTENEILKNSNLFRQPTIPTKDQVWEYFSGLGATKEMAKSFYDKHEATGWFYNGSPIVKWASFANNFVTNWNKIEEQKKTKQTFQQPDPTKVKIKLPNSPTPRYD